MTIEYVEGVNYLSIDDIVYINRSLIETQTPNEPIGVLNPNNLSSSQSDQVRFDIMSRQTICFACLLFLLKA